MKSIFVLVPAFVPTGPIKGAVALVNVWAETRSTTLVSLKGGPGFDAPLSDRVRVISLSQDKGLSEKCSAYRDLLIGSGGRERVVSLSFCFSADMVNLLCRRHAVIGASVRANLLKNYRLDYGLPGAPLAIFHLAAMRGFDHVIAMNAAMADQIRGYAGRMPSVIGNFVDEAPLEVFRRRAPTGGPLRFVFLGSLTPRKRAGVLLQALSELVKAGLGVRLDIVGDGPMRKEVEAEISRLGLCGTVVLHGHLAIPYELVAQADALVLPSSSEGVSRAGLEALHLGVPCVLRDVDGNSELIRPGTNGALFKRDADLASVMLEVAKWSRAREGAKGSLLPPLCRQAVAATAYRDLMESMV